MHYGLSVISSGGAIQLNDSSQCLKTVASGSFNTASGTFTLSGNQVTNKLIAVCNTNYVSKPSWYEWLDMGFYAAEYTYNLISNESRYVPANSTFVWQDLYQYTMRYAVCDASAAWSSGGWGLKILNSSGVTKFNSGDSFFVITSIATLNFSASIAVGYHYFDVPVSTAPYSDANFVFVPPSHFVMRDGTAVKICTCTAFRLNTTTIRVGVRVSTGTLPSALSSAPTSYQMRIMMGVLT